MEKCHSKGSKVATVMFTNILLTINVYVCMYIHNMYIHIQHGTYTGKIEVSRMLCNFAMTNSL